MSKQPVKVAYHDLLGVGVVESITRVINTDRPDSVFFHIKVWNQYVYMGCTINSFDPLDLSVGHTNPEFKGEGIFCGAEIVHSLDKKYDEEMLEFYQHDLLEVVQSIDGSNNINRFLVCMADGNYYPTRAYANCYTMFRHLMLGGGVFTYGNESTVPIISVQIQL